ncbi:MAG: ATP-binding protein, partial [Bacteroidota bacterium]
ILDETIDNIRSITRDLMPTNLERFGLLAAVEDLCKRINDTGELNMSFQYNQKKRIDEQKEFALYRIVQELVNNTLKYAKADEVQIQLTFNEGILKLSYVDNGRGFELEKWRKDTTLQNGLGLRGIETRASVLGADVQLNSAPEKGFQLALNVAI